MIEIIETSAILLALAVQIATTVILVKAIRRMKAR